MTFSDAYVGTGLHTPGQRVIANYDEAEAGNADDPYAPWAPDDERLTPQGWQPVPEWVKGYRQHQWDAALEVVEHFNSGVGLVFVNAPTGSGKTLLADLVTRLMAQPGVYLCTTKSLQDQVLHDFDYARVLKGKANYPTMFMPFPEFTCGDCQGPQGCDYCDPVGACPYRRAKQQAITSQLAVVNMAYWLREANYVRKPAFSLPPDPSIPDTSMGRRRRDGGLFIIDECDTLEDQLLGFIEFALTKTRLRELRITAPGKGVHKTTLVKWINEDLLPAVSRVIGEYGNTTRVEDLRKKRGLEQLLESAREIVDEIPDENWLRDYEREDALPFSMKPVRVDGYGPKNLWRHGGKFVLMSATIISADEMVSTLGYEGEWRVVNVPMTFPVENRPIHVAGVANMTYKTEAEEWPKMVRAVEKILANHPDDRVLIHTVSYPRSKKLMTGLRDIRHTRRFFTYNNAGERDGALEEFRKTPRAVMIAPSFERGIDLAGDECRVQIVVKMPYPNTSDPRVQRRAYGPDGDGWMAVQTIRSLVQMTGRAVRSSDDTCETYILDQQFMSRVWKRNKALLPSWWRESINLKYRVRDLL